VRPVLLFVLITFLVACEWSSAPAWRLLLPQSPAETSAIKAWPDSSGIEGWVVVERKVMARNYFSFLDSVIQSCNAQGIPVDEYLLVHANSWILDTLRSHDYYNLTAKGTIVKDPLALVVFYPGDSLALPDSLHRTRLRRFLSGITLEVNIPAYQLRLLSLGDTLLNAPVRVGRNERAWLAVINTEKNLMTPIGEGKIVRIARDPYYVNPRTGKRYKGTTRDDGVYTRMPQIPWLEPEIDGRRQGSLIHPTTNPETLGKAYSNGCVGTQEDDAWTIYYHAPIGTRVVFKYNLTEVIGGDTIHYEDIYGKAISK